MSVKKGSKRYWGLFVLAAVISMPAPDLYARDPAIPLIRARSAVLVIIQSISTVGEREQRTGLIDKATGHVRVAQRKQPLNYTRSGGGVILSPKGIIVTNAHTVRNAAGIFVTFFGGTKVRGKLIREVPGCDLAFLSVVPPFKLTCVLFADSDKISKGTMVYTQGHSLWHNDTLFRGKVTGVAIGMIRGGPHIAVLQTIFGSEFYLGDSGCPVFDRKGALLGLVIGGRRDGDKATFSVAANVIRDAYQKIAGYSPEFERRGLVLSAPNGWVSRFKKIPNNSGQSPAVL